MLPGTKTLTSHQHGERADIENALHRPDADLRGERDAFLFRDQVRADEFSGAAQQRQSGEADECWAQQSAGARLADRLQKHLPAHGAQQVGAVDQSDSGQDVKLADAAGLGAEAGPVEGAPVLHLEIHQDAQHNDDDGGGEDLLLFHPGREARGFTLNEA